MPVSEALEKSARDFCFKYACEFDFTTFESRVEEFTFLRPVSGWVDVYKMTFEKLYKNTLEKVAFGEIDDDLDAEAMLDDFEYTLIRPYVNEGEKEIKHKPYAGMEKISRLEYLEKLTRDAPGNSVALYEEKYRNGELTIKQMKAMLELDGDMSENGIEIAGCIQALENVNKSRSFIWKAMHPLKNNEEKRNSSMMKKSFIEKTQGDEELYRETVAAAYEPFEGYQMVNANLKQCMIRAREEINRQQKMNDAMRESIHIAEFENDFEQARSPRIEQYNNPSREKQI